MPLPLSAARLHEVYVGVDKQGSLGKKPNLGSIVRLVDKNNDGKADLVTTFAKIDNPRGLIALGDQLIVPYCTVKDGNPTTNKSPCSQIRTRMVLRMALLSPW